MEKMPLLRTVKLFELSCSWRRVLMEPNALILMVSIALWLRLSLWRASKWKKQLLSKLVNRFSASDRSRREPRPCENPSLRDEIRFRLRSNLNSPSRRENAPLASTAIMLSFRSRMRSLRVLWKARGRMALRWLRDRSSCSVKGGRAAGK